MGNNKDWTDKEIEDLKNRRIDFSDIPELTPAYLATLERVVPREHFKLVPIKRAISIKLDSDVLEYYRSKGKGYQTRINKVLRQDMLRETAPAYGKVNNEPHEEEDS
ncbi:MAG: BrnA antitoxin family protein [Sphaerochaeta sp.]